MLPFGVIKGENGLPVPDHRLQPNGNSNFQGLQLAFQEAGEGKTDSEVARTLNAGGYRTTGNHGSNLWRKDSIRRTLTNRFYLGELPGGQGGWIQGKPERILPLEVFEQAQKARRGRQARKSTCSVSSRSRVHSLSGLLRCWYCEQSGDPRRGAMRIENQHSDKLRASCYSRNQGLDCPQRSVFLSVYEEQVQDWLSTLTLPNDAIDRALAQYAGELKTIGNANQERQRLESRLKRLREVYTWGDIGRAEYLPSATRSLSACECSPQRRSSDETCSSPLISFVAFAMPGRWPRPQNVMDWPPISSKK